MRRHQKMAWMTMIWIVALGLAAAGRARGETNVIFVPMPPVTFDAMGIPKEPASVQAALSQGGVDPSLQLVFQNYLLGECVKKALGEAPNQRTFYKNAYQKFANATCTLSRCFQRGMMLDSRARTRRTAERKAKRNRRQCVISPIVSPGTSPRTLVPRNNRALLSGLPRLGAGPKKNGTPSHQRFVGLWLSRYSKRSWARKLKTARGSRWSTFSLLQ